MNQYYKIHDEIVSRTNADGSVIIMKLDDSNIFFKIDGVAALIWKELGHKSSVKDIKSEILNEYNIDEETLEKDIAKLLLDLEQKNLIVKT